MNAYELAEQAEGLAYEIPADWSSGEPKNVATDIADMLRQQADRIVELEKEVLMWENAEVPTEVMADLIQELERRGFITTPQIKELSDEEIKKCVIAWVKQIYGNEYVTPSDRHIINGTKLIRLAEKRIFKNDSL
jgi:hypothetical protein